MSAVDGSRVDALVSGSYDGMLRLWTGAAAHTWSCAWFRFKASEGPLDVASTALN